MPSLSVYYERNVESEGEEFTIKFFIMKKLSSNLFDQSAVLGIAKMNKILGGDNKTLVKPGGGGKPYADTVTDGGRDAAA